MHASSKALTLSWRRSLSYRNQSTDLLWKSMVWFINDRVLMIGSVMKESRRSSPIIHRKSVLTCCKAEFIFFSIWFFFSRIFTIHKTAGEGECYLLISFLPLTPTSQTYISLVIAAESSPLHIDGSRNRTESLWYTLFRIHSFYT